MRQTTRGMVLKITPKKKVENIQVSNCHRTALKCQSNATFSWLKAIGLSFMLFVQNSIDNEQLNVVEVKDKIRSDYYNYY
jgi:hypothetical protein